MIAVPSCSWRRGSQFGAKDQADGQRYRGHWRAGRGLSRSPASMRTGEAATRASVPAWIASAAGRAAACRLFHAFRRNGRAVTRRIIGRVGALPQESAWP